MKSFSERVKPFLIHLENCNGCVGKRNPSNCKFALECSVTEVLSRRGLITNSKELLLYSSNHRSTGYFPEGCVSTDF